MDFLGIGPFELLLILVLAFLFFGPEKLPGMAAKAGRLYRRFKKASSEFSRSFTEDLSSYGNDPEGKHYNIRNDLSELRRSVEEDITSEKKTSRSAEAGQELLGKNAKSPYTISPDTLSDNAQKQKMKTNTSESSGQLPGKDDNERR
jgi:TatA/E family protein of Tat protein translocase